MEQALSLTFWAMLALSLGTVVLTLWVPPTDLTPAMINSAAEPQPD